jgi:hypothetical protein
VAQPHDRFVATTRSLEHSPFNIGCAHSSWHNRTIASWPPSAASAMASVNTLVLLSLMQQHLVFFTQKKLSDLDSHRVPRVLRHHPMGKKTLSPMLSLGTRHQRRK